MAGMAPQGYNHPGYLSITFSGEQKVKRDRGNHPRVDKCEIKLENKNLSNGNDKISIA